MTDSNQPESRPEKKESIQRFVLRTTAPFHLETEALGSITARRMTTGAGLTFARRLKAPDEVADEEVVRAYMGSVSGLPVADEERLPDPLTDEQVAMLTDADVLNFSRAYLQHIVKSKEMGDDPIAQLADYIRQERKEHLSATKKLLETISPSLKIGATADYLKHWQELSKSVVGPVESLREEMQRMLGPIGAMKTSVGDALRELNADRALSKFETQLAFPERSSRDFEPLFRMPDLPPIEETPVGRTAVAVEELSRAGQRMEEAMGLVVEQAGNVSEQMGQVLSKIETESAKSQRTARLALCIGGISLLVSAIALGASAYLSHAGYWADRKDALAEAEAAATMTEKAEQQTAVLHALLAEYQKGLPAPPAAAEEPVDRREQQVPPGRSKADRLDE